MRKARNRLLFADPSVRLAETRNLPKLGGVIISGQHWVPEQVSMWGATDFNLWGFRTMEPPVAQDRIRSAESWDFHLMARVCTARSSLQSITATSMLFM